MWKKGVRFRLQKLGLNLLAACCLLPVIFLLANSLCVGGTVSLTQYEDILLINTGYDFCLFFRCDDVFLKKNTVYE